MKQEKKALTLKTLTKSNVWDIQENDIFRMWEAAEKDAELKDNMRHYTDIIHSAFEMEEIKIDKPEVIKKYELRGFKIGSVRIDDNTKIKLAIKKRPILRVTDLTYENIRHISAAKLMEVLERNFGGGWDSLSQSIQDIIESGFDISTTTLPKDRLHKKGGNPGLLSAGPERKGNSASRIGQGAADHYRPSGQIHGKDRGIIRNQVTGRLYTTCTKGGHWPPFFRPNTDVRRGKRKRRNS